MSPSETLMLMMHDATSERSTSPCWPTRITISPMMSPMARDSGTCTPHPPPSSARGGRASRRCAHAAATIPPQHSTAAHDGTPTQGIPCVLIVKEDELFGHGDGIARAHGPHEVAEFVEDIVR
eukprot:m.52343 g.52343  ORF g.52343 m.52343 type:complete len:123 (-) comp15408_c0_seq3:365-733(-)